MSSQRKNLLDYFSQKSTDDEIESEYEKKKPKTSRTLVSNADSLEKTSFSNTSEENNGNVSNNDICYGSSANTADKFPVSKLNKKKIKFSKVIADYLETQPTDFSEIEYPVVTSETPIGDERYGFMTDIRDANMKSIIDEEYDPTTLFIPEKYYSKFTAFERQFWDIKRKYFDTVIFFKKGKFYELYEGDADIASKLFDLKVTERVNMKMAGIPESSYETWAAKFIAHGYKIGRVDQVENSIGKKIREQDGKKSAIIGRELKEIITTSTVYTSEFLDSCFPFYLCVLKQHENCDSAECTGPMHFSLLLYDASINTIFTSNFCDSYDCNILKTIFVQNCIKELITDEKINVSAETKVYRPDKSPVATTRKYDFKTNEEYECFENLYNFMKSLSREKTLDSAIISPLKQGPEHMMLDGSTLANLDILVNNFNSTEENTLFKAINHCNTPFGKRLLRKWIVSPLKDLGKINERRRIANLFSKYDTSDIIICLKSIGDIERRAGRISCSNPTFKDLRAFITDLKKEKHLFDLFNDFFESFELCDQDRPELLKYNLQQDICKKHQSNLKSILESFECAYSITDTEIAPGNANDELFILNNEQAKIRKKLDNFVLDLKKSTGYTDICYKSIGKEIFQLETSVNNKMPSAFYTVSSTKTHKRYYSLEFKKIVTSFEECEERIFQSKCSILRRAVEFLKPFIFDIGQATNHLAVLDCLLSYSTFNRYFLTTSPIFGEKLELVDFTNPVYPDYIKNNFNANSSTTLITGPNMGGKSTFLRSICLNIILAQMGMNVLCREMKLPVFDQIFTRIGASDSLARGESTFMIEMNEASKILNTSTKTSFVIIDELGRGTSTKDGEAIALAVLDYLKNVGCTCLFSTHYHKLVEEYQGADKMFVKCKVEEKDITFLYKIQNGICVDSHGLHVARLAGIPDAIVDKAFEIKKLLTGD
ncbi:DNA mismatch repair protein msh6 [Glugoides intestinalis]